MNKTQQQTKMTFDITKYLERVDEYWNEHDGTHFYKDELKSLFATSLSEVYKLGIEKGEENKHEEGLDQYAMGQAEGVEFGKRAGIEEAIKLSDEIEARNDTPDINEWKAFKAFRNKLRDELNQIK